MGRYRWRQRLPSFTVLPILHYCNRRLRRRRRQFCRAATCSGGGGIFAGSIAAAAFQLSMSLSPSSGVQKKTQKPLLYSGLTGFTPLCTGKLFRTSQRLPRFHEKTARKTLVSNCSRKPLLLLLYSTTYYYYIVLHSILHRVA